MAEKEMFSVEREREDGSGYWIVKRDGVFFARTNTQERADFIAEACNYVQAHIEDGYFENLASVE